jgi:hypothetical protein
VRIICSALLAAGLLTAPATGRAQQGVLLPEESAAKAKELIQQAIAALGGPAYLGVRDITRAGRFANFSRQGDLAGYVKFWDFTKLPDKNRTEFTDKRNFIFVNNGSEGWELDKGGVQEITAEAAQRFQEGLMKDIDHLFRARLDEEGMVFRYSGSDIVDLKQVDWVEVVDRERRTLRIAFDRASRLPIRTVFITRDRTTRQRTEEVEYLSNYHPVQGIQTPFQIARERNGQKVYQVFISECQYNTGLDDSLFTRASLEQRWAELNKGKKKK